MTTLKQRIDAFLNPPNGKADLERSFGSTVSVRVDDSAGWTAIKGSLNTGRPHERDFSEVQSIYEDALTAFRKNPIAWRIIQTTTNYILGDRIVVSGKRRDLNKFIEAFWNHPKNLMDLRLAAMSDDGAGR